MEATLRGPMRSCNLPAGIIIRAKEARAMEKAHWVVDRFQPMAVSRGLTKTLNA